MTCGGCVEKAEVEIPDADARSPKKTITIARRIADGIEKVQAEFTSPEADEENSSATPQIGRSYLVWFGEKDTRPRQWAWLPSDERFRSAELPPMKPITRIRVPYIALNLWSYLTPGRYVWEKAEDEEEKEEEEGEIVLVGEPKERFRYLPRLTLHIGEKGGNHLITEMVLREKSGQKWVFLFPLSGYKDYGRGVWRPQRGEVRAPEGKSILFFKWCLAESEDGGGLFLPSRLELLIPLCKEAEGISANIPEAFS